MPEMIVEYRRTAEDSLDFVRGVPVPLTNHAQKKLRRPKSKPQCFWPGGCPDTSVFVSGKALAAGYCQRPHPRLTPCGSLFQVFGQPPKQVKRCGKSPLFATRSGFGANDDRVAVTFVRTVNVSGSVGLSFDTVMRLLVRDQTAGNIALIKVSEGIAKVTEFANNRNLQFDQSNDHPDDQNSADQYEFRRQNNAAFVLPEVLHCACLFT